MEKLLGGLTDGIDYFRASYMALTSVIILCGIMAYFIEEHRIHFYVMITLCGILFFLVYYLQSIIDAAREKDLKNKEKNNKKVKATMKSFNEAQKEM